MAKGKKFNWRGFVSLYITISFIVMAISGIILYFSPPGRVALWSYWTFIGLSKAGWQAVHTIFTFIFIVMGIFHIYFNWKPLMAYLKNKIKSKTKLRTELTSAVIISVLIFAFTVYEVPPFSTVMDFGETLSESWEDEQTEPPIPHAEELTLQEFADVIKMPMPELLEKLTQNGFKLSSQNITIQELADQNNVAPNKIYLAVKNERISNLTYETVGSGFGRKTLIALCEEIGISVEEALSKLEQNNIEATGDEKIKEIAQRSEMLPIDIVNIIKTNE